MKTISNKENELVLATWEDEELGYNHLCVAAGCDERLTTDDAYELYFYCKSEYNYREAAVKMITTTPNMTLKQAKAMAIFLEMWQTDRCSEYIVGKGERNVSVRDFVKRAEPAA
jgi:hypothetical protein